jgi:hypothetical protein
VTRILAIVVVSFAAGVPAGYFLAISTYAKNHTDDARQHFSKPVPQADLEHAQEMKPRW